MAITSYPDEPPPMLENFRKHWPIPITGINDAELLEKSPILRDFREKFDQPVFHGKYGDKYDYNHDAMRFAWKVFAITTYAGDADVIFWVDSDIHTHADVPNEFVNSILPYNCYTAAFHRSNMHPECGFVAYRKSDKCHTNVMRTWERLYETGAIFMFPQWHDCTAYSAVTHDTKTHNLTEVDCMHPMINSKFGKYIDHRKGNRKENGSTSADLVIPRGEEYWTGR